MEDKYIIIDLERQVPFAESDCKVKVFETYLEARMVCYLNKLDGCVIAQIIYQYEENPPLAKNATG